MDKLSIVYFHANYAYYLNYTHFREALAKIADVHFYESPVMEEGMAPLYDGDKLAREHKADAIIIGVNNTVHRAVSNLENTDTLKIMLSDDPHNWLARQSAFMNKSKIDIMLMMNYGNWHGKPENYPKWWITPWKLASDRPHEIYGGEIPIADKYQRQLNYKCKFMFFPESVNTSFFKDRNYVRDIDVFNSGSFSASVYPLRCQLFEIFRNRPHIKSGIKPSFAYSWEDYAQTIARSKCLVEGVGIFGYTSQRFTQAMASKTLMASSLPFDNEENHFIPNYNFIEIDPRKLHRSILKIESYLNDGNARKRIVENAYNTILKYHTSDIRAREMVDIIKCHM